MINKASAIIGGFNIDFLLAIVVTITATFHNLSASTLAMIVITDHLAMSTQIMLKAFQPSVDFTELQQLGATFLNDTR